MCFSKPEIEFPAIPAPPPPPAPAPIPGAREIKAPAGQSDLQRNARARGSSRLKIPLSNVNIPS